MLDLQLTDNNEVMKSTNINSNMSTSSGGTNYNDKPDFSVVEKQNSDDSSISSASSGEYLYAPDNETTIDSDNDEELDNKCYSVDGILNRWILHVPNQDCSKKMTLW